MSIGTYICITLVILALFATYKLTKIYYCDKFEEDISNTQKKYDREISQLKDNLEKSITNYESLKPKYEELLTRLKNEGEKYYKLFSEKCATERHIADLQKDLYCSRKHTKKMTKDFVSILSKLLGVNKV